MSTTALVSGYGVSAERVCRVLEDRWGDASSATWNNRATALGSFRRTGGWGSALGECGPVATGVVVAVSDGSVAGDCAGEEAHELVLVDDLDVVACSG